MCWNERISWITFILGTIFNIYLFVNTSDIIIKIISILIQWLLLMQFFEALAWRNQNCGNLNKFATNGALIANLTQPIILCLLLLIFSQVSIKNKIISMIIIIFYICYIIYSLNKNNNYNCIKPNNNCNHLDLYWWKNINGYIYCITLLSILLLLIRPIKLSIFISGYIFLTLFISILFYSCGAASIWCWFVSFFPLVLIFYIRSKEKQY
jgi:hypothetical protein